MTLRASATWISDTKNLDSHSVPALRFWPLIYLLPGCAHSCQEPSSYICFHLSLSIMSSLKDIMDVDVEPLESQAYRRREAAQQASHPTIPQTSQSPSPPIDESNKGKTPIRRRKSNRVSKSAAQSSTAHQNIARRRNSASGETMEYTSAYQAGGSNQASMSGSPQQSPRGLEPVADLPVKYTPVTGRLSRAKKGVPVHTCDICRPVKVCSRNMRLSPTIANLFRADVHAS